MTLWFGNPVFCTGDWSEFEIDFIRVVGYDEIIPALPVWSLVTLAALLIASASWVLGRRRG